MHLTISNRVYVAYAKYIQNDALSVMPELEWWDMFPANMDATLSISIEVHVQCLAATQPNVGVSTYIDACML